MSDEFDESVDMSGDMEVVNEEVDISEIADDDVNDFLNSDDFDEEVAEDVDDENIENLDSEEDDTFDADSDELDNIEEDIDQESDDNLNDTQSEITEIEEDSEFTNEQDNELESEDKFEEIGENDIEKATNDMASNSTENEEIILDDRDLNTAETASEKNETENSDIETTKMGINENSEKNEMRDASQGDLDEKTPFQNLFDYMNAHNYGREDYDEYSKDPEWQSLHKEAFPEHYESKDMDRSGDDKENGYSTISASEISGVDHSGEHFWEHHTNSKADYMELASKLPEVQEQLVNGISLDEIKNNPNLRDCASAYYDKSKMVKVVQSDNGYEFQDDGRHRVAAAQALGYDIPVSIINTENNSVQEEVNQSHDLRDQGIKTGEDEEAVSKKKQKVDEMPVNQILQNNIKRADIKRSNRDTTDYDNSIEAQELRELGIQNVDLCNCNSEYRPDILSAVKDMFNKNPELCEQLSTIRCCELPEGIYANYGPTKAGEKFGGCLNLNSQEFTSKTLRDDLAEESKNGWSIPNATPKSIVLHELGHGIHLDLCAKANGIESGTIPMYERYKNAVIQYRDNIHVDKIVEEACKTCGIEFDSWEFSDGLTKYSAGDYGEAFAEAIAEVRSNENPRPLAKAIYLNLTRYRENPNEFGLNTVDLKEDRRRKNDDA